MRIKQLIKTAIVLVAVLLALATDWVAGAVDVHLDHWVYGYLDRMWTTGILERNLSSIRPLSRIEVAEGVGEVMRAAESGDARLTAVDLGQLAWLKAEFAYELASLGFNPGEERERNLYRWERGEDHLVCDLILGGRSVSRTRGGEAIKFIDVYGLPMIRGGLKGNLFYSADFTYGDVYFRDGPVNKEEAGIGGYWKPAADQAHYDIGQASLVFRLPWFDLHLGKQKLSWGPGYRGNVCLSDYAPSFDFLNLKAEYGPVRFISLLGALKTEVIERSYRTADSLFVREISARKWIAAHRLELAPHRAVQIGLSEAIIYGEKGIEPGYLNPLMFFWPAQHNWGDEDNLVMTGDIMIRPMNGLRLYGSLLFDEFDLKGVYTGKLRNKTASQVGFQFSPPLDLLRDISFRGDYARVQPGVYTHKFPVNTYTNWELPLGYWTGENSDELFLEASYRMKREVRLELSAFRQRRGEPTPQPYAQDPNPDLYPFLHGTVETTSGFGGSISYQPVYNLVFSLGWFRKSYSNYRNVDGDQVDESELSLRFYAKY